ncbi:MAG: hypothetical protein WC329_06255 [Candidatus Omnitrophota bacterium]|jgi:hypothetical protein
MITESQFEDVAGALAADNPALLADHVHNHRTNIVIRGITGAQAQTIFEVLPDGAWPDYLVPEDPPSHLKRAPSLYFMVFKKSKK